MKPILSQKPDSRPRGSRTLDLAAYFLATLFLTLGLLSCVTYSPDTRVLLPSSESGRGPLVSADFFYLKAASQFESNFEAASVSTLSLFIDTGLLKSLGYEAWRKGALTRLNDVQAVKIRFRTSLGDYGPGRPRVEDLQSGMLYLPAAQAGKTRAITWIVFTKGTEMVRDNVPSRDKASESPIAASLAALGYAVWMPDYAGMGESPGIHPFCVPESLAASCLDGLKACRDYAANAGLGAAPGSARNTKAQEPDPIPAPAYRETGRFAVLGYSEGGLAAMAALKAYETNPEGLEGLRLSDAYVLGAPLFTLAGVSGSDPEDLPIARPEYQIFLALGWQRIFPDLVKIEDIFVPVVVEEIVPLFDGTRSSRVLRAEISRRLEVQLKDLRARHLYQPDYLLRLRDEPASLAFYRLQERARLDEYLPSSRVRLVLATSETDEIVNPLSTMHLNEVIKNSQNSAGPGNLNEQSPVSYVSLASPRHIFAGVEALFFASFDFDLTERRRGAFSPSLFADTVR